MLPARPAPRGKIGDPRGFFSQVSRQAEERRSNPSALVDPATLRTADFVLTLDDGDTAMLAPLENSAFADIASLSVANNRFR